MFTFFRKCLLATYSIYYFRPGLSSSAKWVSTVYNILTIKLITPMYANIYKSDLSDLIRNIIYIFINQKKKLM